MSEQMILKEQWLYTLSWGKEQVEDEKEEEDRLLEGTSYSPPA